ncbi:MAG: hypothetical protein LBM96_08750 [Methanobrevibacter sp.]|jgi:hypothetical protein|nr:hypothetical protein [Candidatus Methanoflexus mossambicus]
MKIKDLLNETNGKIFVRGEDYYYNGYISSLIYDPQKNTYHGEVEGSNFKDYDVKIELDKDNNILDYSCNCPYDWSHVCKHIVAVLLAIENEDYIESSQKQVDSEGSEDIVDSKDIVDSVAPIESLKSAKSIELAESSETIGNIRNIKNKRGNKEDIINLIAKSDENDLKKFIIEKGFKYGDFQRDLYRFLKKPGVNEEIKLLIGDIKSIISNNSYISFDRDPYYLGDEIDEYCEGLEKIFNQAEESLNDKRYMVPFHVSIELINGINSLFDFLFESYSIDNLMDSSFRMLKDACDLIKINGTLKEKESCFKLLIKNSKKKFSLNEYNYNFINETLKFINKSNKNEVYDAIDSIEDGEYYYSENMILKSKIIEITEGKVESEKFKRNNIQIDEFAMELIEKAINNQDFKYSEKIALKKVNENKNKNGWNKDKWEKILYGIYDSFKVINKQIEIANNLLKKGNSSYYFILKELYAKIGELDKKQDELFDILIENSTFNDYAPILKKEKQWELLWEKVKDHPDSIFEYGPELVKIYKDDVYKFYFDVLINKGESANDRKKYRLFVKDLRKLYDIDGKKYADKVFDYFRENYKIRRAMQEELNVLNLKRNRKE